MDVVEAWKHYGLNALCFGGFELLELLRVKGDSQVELEDVASLVLGENMAERDNRVHASGQGPERLHLLVVFDLNGGVDLVLPAREVDPDSDNHLVLPIFLVN